MECNVLLEQDKKTAVLYYSTWSLCFIGRELTIYSTNGSINVISDLANSIFELCFAEMFGFKKGLYCNAVGWFFSAYLIIIFLVGPWLAKFKEKYIYYAAPLIMFFSYGALSILYDYMYAPDFIIPNTVIHKGIVRALAGINAGVFSFGISSAIYNEKGNSRGLRITGYMLCGTVIAYSIYPFASNVVEVSLQYDYIITLVLIIGLILIFTYSSIDIKNLYIQMIIWVLLQGN